MKDVFTWAAILMVVYFAGILSWIFFRRYFLILSARIKKRNAAGIKKDYGPWSIGIYEGNTPFDLADPGDALNPVLTADEINDLDARFVADPFMLAAGGKFYAFFEALERTRNRGEIAYAISDDGRTWRYRQSIIREDFHLSYPYVFKWNEDYYLIPESAEDFSVRLYRAASFPDKWKYVGNLLDGYRYLDPSVFRFKNKWWLFVGTGSSNVLNLYYSDDLPRGWRPHPKNPIVKRNGHIARSGGRVIAYNDQLYRFAQDDEPGYGSQVFAFEITELSETSYQERLVSEKPVIAKTGRGWNASGMHTVDVQKVADKWLAIVDGADRPGW